MSFTASLVSKVIKADSKGLINNVVTNNLSATPIPQLIKPLNAYYHDLLGRQSAYDAISLALASINELFDAASGLKPTVARCQIPDSRIAMMSGDDTNPCICLAEGIIDQISDQEHPTVTGSESFISSVWSIWNGLYQASVILGDPGNLTITSAAGQLYSFIITAPGAISYQKIDGRAELSYQASLIKCVIKDPVDEVASITVLGSAEKGDKFYITQKLFPTYMQLFGVARNYDRELCEDWVTVLSNIVSSAELNAAQANTCEVLVNGRFSAMKDLISEGINSKKKVVRSFFSGLKNAYNSGGFKGCAYYIFSYMKGSTTLTNEDGLLTFTDNSQLMPREYIAGLISGIIQTVTTALSAIVAIFNQAVGLALSLVGSAVWGIIGSFKQDFNDTFASLPFYDNDEKQSQVLPMSPLAIFKGENTITTGTWQWYLEEYDLGHTVVYIDVPGGSIVVGPGAFDQNDTDKVTKVRWEFHPSTWCGKFDSNIFSPILSRRWDTGHNQRSWVIDMNEVIRLGGYNYVAESWLTITSNTEWSVFLSNGTDGHLSQGDDTRAAVSMFVSTQMFLLAVLSDSPELVQLYRDGVRFCTAPTFWSGFSPLSVVTGTEIDWMYFAQFLAGNYSGVSADFQSSWSSWINHFDYMYSNSIPATFYAVNSDGEIYEHIETIYSVSASDFGNTTVRLRRYIGYPVPLPSYQEYGIIMPKYNGKTFLAWVILAAGVTVAVTAAVVIASMKIRKALKAKRAKNVVKNDEARTNYQDAVKGQRGMVDAQGNPVIDESTGQQKIEYFDVNSAEGKAYINSTYNSYYKTVKSNNMWASIFGGSRYDTTTYYGDAADDESESILDKVRNNAAEAWNDTDDSEIEAVSDTVSASLNKVLALISGS